MKLFVTGIFILLTSLITQADNLNLLPNFFYDGQNYTTEHVLLGRTCYSLPGSWISLSCNPAELAREEKHVFRMHILLDGNFSEVSEYGKLLINKNNYGLVERLVQQRGSMSSRSQFSIWYQRDWWALSVVPVRFSYASFITNPAYPVIAANIVRESEVSFKSGFYLSDNTNWQFGFEMRAVDRDFLYQDFALLDAVADPDLIRIRNSTALYFEPALIYRFSDDAWKPSVSFAITNIELANSSAVVKTKPSGELGFSAEPEFADGKLVTTTHITMQQEIQELSERLRWAAIYKTGWADFIASLAKKDYGVGVSTEINTIVLGFTFRQEELNSNQWKTEHVSSYNIDLGLSF